MYSIGSHSYFDCSLQYDSENNCAFGLSCTCPKFHFAKNFAHFIELSFYACHALTPIFE